PERRDGGDEVEGGPNRPLGVVLGRDRSSPDGHDGVADELLDGAAVQLDQAPACVEVPREKLARLLGVALLGGRGEADQVGEEDGDEPALRGGRRSRRWALGRDRGLSRQRGAALTAELLPGRIRVAARGAAGLELGAALAAELLPGSVLRTATR